MPHGKVCSRSGAVFIPPARCECQACVTHRRRDNARRGRNLYTSGRRSEHWRKLRPQAIARDRVCRRCGTGERLTVHLDPALRGEHRNATLDDVVTLCVSCHGSVDAPRARGRAA
jgi:5-methylcytosine-specific restriction endonuclease McrA